jgi:hypothetical protein
MDEDADLPDALDYPVTTEQRQDKRDALARLQLGKNILHHAIGRLKLSLGHQHAKIEWDLWAAISDFFG